MVGRTALWMVVDSVHRRRSGAGTGAARVLAWVLRTVQGRAGGEGESMAGSGRGPGAGAGGDAPAGPVAAAVVAFGRGAVAAEAARVRDAGTRIAERAGELTAALEGVAIAAGGVYPGVPGGLLSGPALEECAALLARRARDAERETQHIAVGMNRAADLLVEADEEAARDVTGAGG